MIEAKPKSPAEVWKILPLKHKIISVVAAITVASVGASAIYYAVTESFPSIGPSLTPARDLTGTWRNPISGQGLIVWASEKMVSPGEVYVSSPNVKDADIVRYFNVEWNVTQTGNTIVGTMTITLVKTEGKRPFMFQTLPGKPAPLDASGTYYVTGIVEGTKITITSDTPPTGLVGSFTEDMMTLTMHKPGSCSCPPETPSCLCSAVDVRAKLSLSRVW